MDTMIMEDGHPHYYQITKSAARDESNNIIGIVGVVMDVTATRVQFSGKRIEKLKENLGENADNAMK